ncbi:uncharacterized protein Bfra_010043 [Botrytis fragariae]|uniref:2EXR domain-containing protein n=1 Tax=Botrytis fragariae TaxID=1964551 RepID=A0A8H6EF67_9HELO|nr:uncharacterized protein Bfra_010043 [Botrytis fragariae]KAF5869898.1 hypothetical protein Bfra_010043 [Botrytis fragariae]
MTLELRTIIFKSIPLLPSFDPIISCISEATDYLPPKKRICLSLHHYAISATSEDSDIAVQEHINSKALQRRETPTDRFYMFRWLPKELQLEIWKMAALDIDAQIITIDTKVHPINDQSQVNQYHRGTAYIHKNSASTDTETTSLTAQYQIPSLLHACEDAREVGLKYYRPVFGREIGGAPIYMAIDHRRAPDTFCFNNLKALTMLRSSTRNFNRGVKNDMDSIKSAIVCMKVHNLPRRNYRGFRWITSSLREINTLWIAQDKPCICSRRHTTMASTARQLLHSLAETMIEQHATLQQKKKLESRDLCIDEIIRCVESPGYSSTNYGFEIPQAKLTSVDKLKQIYEQSDGRGARSLATLEYLQKLLK